MAQITFNTTDTLPQARTTLNANITDLGVQLATKLTADSVIAPFVDLLALVKGSVDATKLLRFELDGFTAATTRVLTPPNYNGTIATLAGAESFSNKTFSGTAAMSQVDIASSIEMAPGADINFEDDTSALNMNGAPITGAGELRVGANKVVGAQGAAIADATDAPSAITQLNALLARARAHGFIAT